MLKLKNLHLCFIVLLLHIVLQATAADITIPEKRQYLELPPDTTRYGEDIDGIEQDTITKTRKELQGNFFDALDYTLDTRYMAYGDSLKNRKWYQDMFLQMGLGSEQILPVIDGYRISPLTTFHIGFGKQLGRYTSFRFLAHGGISYQQDMDRLYLRGGGNLDLLVNLNSFLGGYDPSRKIELGAFAGVGLGYAAMRNTANHDKYVDAHGGLQLKFYTGPNSMINIEPYATLASDQIDVSKDRNWRKFDVAFGVNMNVVYYFENHLTRNARRRIIKQTKEKDDNLINKNDSTSLYSWQRPWIWEFATGPTMSNYPNLKMKETLGHEVAISFGKWFSPVIGIRSTVMTSYSDWLKNMKYEIGHSYEVTMSTFYIGGRIEAMFNPFGFTKRFRWDAPFGAYLTGGVGLGRLIKYKDPPSLKCWSESYSGGIHLWARLTDGLQIFIEPRITHNVYNIPYKNVNWASSYSDDTYGINFGVTATNIKKTYRKYHTDDHSTMKHIAVGVGAGTTLTLPATRISDSNKQGINLNAFAEYRVSPISAVRLSFEFLQLKSSNLNKYLDYNAELAAMGYAPVRRNGFWHYTHSMGLLALNYSLNLTNAMCGYRTTGPKGRIFNLELFAGPAIVMQMGEKAEIDAVENIRENHFVESLQAKPRKVNPAVNGGVKLSAHITPELAIVLTPQIYFVPKLNIPSINMNSMKNLETINLGVQYQF